MTRVLWCASFVTLLVVAGVGARSTTSASADGSPILRDAAASKEELAQRLLDALEKTDLQALRRLRVTEAEYKDVILPGSVDVGQPLRKYPPDVADYAWKTLNTKSLYYERFLLHTVGGDRFRIRDLTFAKGVADYATYRAYRQLRLAVTKDDGTKGELATGSIVEVDGRYKFISFVRD
jgi:hypothetical protein